MTTDHSTADASEGAGNATICCMQLYRRWAENTAEFWTDPDNDRLNSPVSFLEACQTWISQPHDYWAQQIDGIMESEVCCFGSTQIATRSCISSWLRNTGPFLKVAKWTLAHSKRSLSCNIDQWVDRILSEAKDMPPNQHQYASTDTSLTDPLLVLVESTTSSVTEFKRFLLGVLESMLNNLTSINEELNRDEMVNNVLDPGIKFPVTSNEFTASGEQIGWTESQTVPRYSKQDDRVSPPETSNKPPMESHVRNPAVRRSFTISEYLASLALDSVSIQIFWLDRTLEGVADSTNFTVAQVRAYLQFLLGMINNGGLRMNQQPRTSF